MAPGANLIKPLSSEYTNGPNKLECLSPASQGRSLLKGITFQVLLFRVGSWPYPRTFYARKDFLGQTLQLILSLNDLRRKKIYKVGSQVE